MPPIVRNKSIAFWLDDVVGRLDVLALDLVAERGSSHYRTNPLGVDVALKPFRKHLGQLLPFLPIDLQRHNRV